MELGMIGAGRMGSNMARRLRRAGHDVVMNDVDSDALEPLHAEGFRTAPSLADLVAELERPRHLWLMIPAAFVGATFVVLAGAISMEEAYRGVEWRAVFLVACILPVGMAMERTGAALLISGTVTDVAGPLGPYAVLAGLFGLASLLSQCLDGAPAVVLLTPVALGTAEQLGLSPYPIMMGISLAASAAFMTPFSHKANLLVMGAGGYRVTDFLRAGTPLTVIVLILLVVLVPVFFPVN